MSTREDASGTHLLSKKSSLLTPPYNLLISYPSAPSLMNCHEPGARMKGYGLYALQLKYCFDISKPDEYDSAFHHAAAYLFTLLFN